MITTILMWTGIGFAHLVIGTYIGKWSLKVWNKGKENFQSFLLFPLSTVMESVGSQSAITPISDFRSDENYVRATAFSWSVRLAWSCVAIPLIGLILGLGRVGTFVADIAGHIADVVAQPVAMIEKIKEKRWQKKLAKAHQLKLSPVDPFLDGYTRDDIETQMEEQRKIVDAATSQAEGAKKEYERLKEIHTTTWSRG